MAWNTGDIILPEDAQRWDDKAPNTVATTTAAGLMSAADKTKLGGIATGAQVNPGLVTSSSQGLMSNIDKTKLDGISTGATQNTPATDFTSTSTTQYLSAKQLKDYMQSSSGVNLGSSALVDIPKSSNILGTGGLVLANSAVANTADTNYTEDNIIAQIRSLTASDEYNWSTRTNSTVEKTIPLGKILMRVLGQNYSTFPLSTEEFEIIGLENIRKSTDGRKYTKLYTRGGVIATIKYIGVNTNLTIDISGSQVPMTSNDLFLLDHTRYPMLPSETHCMGTYIISDLVEPGSIVTTYIVGSASSGSGPRSTYQIRQDLASPYQIQTRNKVGTAAWSAWS